MSRTYFDRNHHLQINGDINFISHNRPSRDDPITQRVRSTSSQSRAFDREIFKILCDNTAPSALYKYGHSFAGSQCHPGTRVGVQDYIFQWLDDPDGQIAMWMNGPVGIGKTAIAQTVAHLAAEKGRLSSAFFFFRSDDTRNSAKHLVPTLAYEMVQQIPRTRSRVCQTVDANPLIFSSSIDSQIHSVLLHSLRTRFESSPRPRRLIIIDGLDECLDTDIQQGIIHSFISSLLSSHILPHKLLIVSRPESHIASALSTSSIRAHVKHLPLSSWSTSDDIRKFLREKLEEIKDTHPMKRHLPAIWPDEYSFSQLRQRSVGSFAYASAITRFLASHKHNPEPALRNILSLQVTSAFTELDTLYRHILLSLDADICFTVQKVLCLYLYSGHHDVMSLAAGLSEEQSAVEIALIHVPSLIHFDGKILELHHTSFGEFLQDKERSGEYHVFSPDVLSTVATALSNLWSHPVHDDNFVWFSIMCKSILGENAALDMHILRALAVTKISASILTVSKGHEDNIVKAVVEFFRAIQQRCAQDFNPTYKVVYSDALNVVCLWLRSHLNARFQGLATLSDILDIIITDFPNYLDVSKKDLSLHIFFCLARQDCKPFDLLCRLLPEMKFPEVCSGIVEKFLALPSMWRQSDATRHYRCLITLVTLSSLYVNVLGRHEAVDPNLCQKLEKLVSDGLKVLGSRPNQDRSSKHCIFRILYGATCEIDDEGQIYIHNGYNYLSPSTSFVWRNIVETTDYYIREVRCHVLPVARRYWLRANLVCKGLGLGYAQVWFAK